MTKSRERLRSLWRAVRVGGAVLVTALALSAIAPDIAFAQDTPAAVEEVAPAPEAAAEEAAPAAITAPEATVDKADTAWMMVSAVLVLLMIIPGLALFYSGLVRTKNALSVLMQVGTVTVIGMILYALVGYSLSFTTGPTAFLDQFIGGTARFVTSTRRCSSTHRVPPRRKSGLCRHFGRCATSTRSRTCTW